MVQTHKSISVTDHINKLKNKNHMIISDAEKAENIMKQIDCNLEQMSDAEAQMGGPPQSEGGLTFPPRPTLPCSSQASSHTPLSPHTASPVLGNGDQPPAPPSHPHRMQE